MDGPTKRPFRTENKSYQGVCTVTDIHINPESEDPMGKIRNPELNISGFLARVTIRDNLAEDPIFLRSYIHIQELSITMEGPQSPAGTVHHSGTLSIPTSRPKPWTGISCSFKSANLTEIGKVRSVACS